MLEYIEAEVGAFEGDGEPNGSERPGIYATVGLYEQWPGFTTRLRLGLPWLPQQRRRRRRTTGASGTTCFVGRGHTGATTRMLTAITATRHRAAAAAIAAAATAAAATAAATAVAAAPAPATTAAAVSMAVNHHRAPAVLLHNPSRATR